MAKGRKKQAPIAPPPLFEFCVKGPALSAQTRDRTRLKLWQKAVAKAAKRAWPKGQPPLGDTLELVVTEYSEIRIRDRDNFAKPIADALQGICYLNDKQIVTLKSRWKDLEGRFRVRHMSTQVAEAFVTGHPFVRVRLWLDEREGELG